MVGYGNGRPRNEVCNLDWVVTFKKYWKVEGLLGQHFSIFFGVSMITFAYLFTILLLYKREVEEDLIPRIAQV